MAGLHPTIDEQLEGIARLLDRTAAGHGDDPMATRLRTAAGTLRRLTGSWSTLLTFLSWDNEATASLLADLAASVPAELTARAGSLDSPLDPLDVAAVQDCNIALRGLLAEAIRALPPDAADARTMIAGHLRERIARDPSAGRPR